MGARYEKLKKLIIQNLFLVIKKRKSIKTQIHRGTDFFCETKRIVCPTKIG